MTKANPSAAALVSWKSNAVAKPAVLTLFVENKLPAWLVPPSVRRADEPAKPPHPLGGNPGAPANPPGKSRGAGGAGAPAAGARGAEGRDGGSRWERLVDAR